MMHSLGVVIPTRNSMPYLPGHVETVSAWADLASEIVVVDSESHDGSAEYLRSHLKHASLRVLSHPPGLYASWNFGIRRLQSEHTYIATVGDSITREGILHLLGVVQQLRCDVLVSPPRLKNTSGRRVSSELWPVHEIIRHRKIESPAALQPEEVFCYAAAYALGRGLNGILGSAASNLYRTPVLQANPFPVDCNSVGDTFWGLVNAFRVRFAITPQSHSTFLFHPKERRMSGVEYHQLCERAAVTIRRMLECERERLGGFPIARTVAEIVETDQQYRDACSKLEACRSGSVPWILKPEAWRLRRLRNQHCRRWRQLVNLIRTMPGPAQAREET